jgi:hypothetical protein
MLIPDYVKDPKIRKRIGIEIRIVRHLIRMMKKGGWDVYAVNDGEEFQKLKGEKKALEAAFAVDEASLYFENKSLPFTREDGTTDCVGHHVYLVFGNDGWDVIADWSYSEAENDTFNAIMEAVGDYSDTIADKY